MRAVCTDSGDSRANYTLDVEIVMGILGVLKGWGVIVGEERGAWLCLCGGGEEVVARHISEVDR